MKTRRLVGLAAASIRGNLVRSFLTMLGVVIGVGSVVVMVAIGQGARREVVARVGSLGTHLIVITPGATTRGGVSGGAGTQASLTVADAELLRREAFHLAEVTPVIVSPSRVIAGNNNWRTQVLGVEPGYQAIRAWTLASGRFFDANDIRALRKVCLVGARVAEMLFGTEDPLGRTLVTRDVPLEIIGVLATKGPTADGADQDDVVLAPASTVRTRLAGRQFIGQILASANSAAEISDARTEVTAILRESHGLSRRDPDDFTVRDQGDLATTAEGTTKVMTTLLLCVASVSLLVGGIGIMNIMLVSVTERTREIGIRRALGARRRDVLAQFLVEAVVLSSAGGFLGAALGIAASEIVGWATGWATDVTAGSVLLAVGFSMLVGIFFGWVPARRAAALDPIEALRFQ